MFQVVTPTASTSTSSSSLRPAAHHVHLSGHSSNKRRAIEDDDGDYNLDGEDDDGDDDEEDQDYSSNLKLATPGQILGSLSTYMRGHGTHLIHSSNPSQPSQIASSLTGRVILTNRLLSLQPFFTRYTPETGDLVLGRVLSVLPGARRWKIDIESSSNSNLALSAINLPGGIQRRKLASDELQMRSFFKEGDLLVAEVQGVYNDGSTSLHTRSLRYGKLRNGRLVIVPCKLVKRGKSHFIKLTSRDGHLQIDMILGLNGWIWLSAIGAMQASGSSSNQNDSNNTATGSGRDIDAGATYSDALNLPSSEILATLSTLTNLINTLAQSYLPISEQSIQAIWDIHTDLQSETTEGIVSKEVLLPLVKADLKEKGLLSQSSQSQGGITRNGDEAMEWDN
ncbi:unnamed protein product [Sympodiomycopsis kandeliae]